MLPKKVLHIMNSASGGAALSTMDIIRGLKEKGIESSIVCHDAGTPEEKNKLSELVDERILFTPLYWWNKKIRTDLWKRPILQVLQILRTGWKYSSSQKIINFAVKHQIELIHTNTLLTPEGGIAAKELYLPHVWHIRELVGKDNPFQFYKTKKGLMKYLREHTSLCIANSHATAKYFIHQEAEDWIRVVPNGIHFKQTKNRYYEPENLVVAVVANLTSSSKKHALFIEAMALLPQVENVEYRIYGYDSKSRYSVKIHRLAAKIVKKNQVRFMGHGADPEQIMNEIDVLVHPSDQESFGRIVVEAMMSGCPVVGVKGGGAAEIVEHGITGLLAEPDNPESLSDCMLKLIQNPELRKKFGQAGQQRAKQHFSFQRCFSELLTVYGKAMERPLGQQS